MSLKSLLVTTAALALGLAGPAVQAQTATPARPAPAAAPATTDADPALWVVKDDDTTIYLFGTVHVLKPGLSWFDEAVKDAFDKSDQLVLEMVLPDPVAAQGVVNRVAVNPTGPALPDLLPADKRDAYRAAVTGLGMPATAFDRYDPWYAASTITVLSLMKGGYNPQSGAEMTLTAAATTAKKPIVGLETFEEQLGFFDTLDQPLQVRFLTSTVDDLPRAGTMLDAMVDDWSAGRTDALAAKLNEGMREIPEIGKVLLGDRNQRWAEWIDNRLDQPGTVFIAVGAGHLAGDDSVQVFLAKRNLKAQRIDY